MNDVYYSPEKFGLTTVGEFDMSSGAYEFDLFVVWQNAEGRYFWGQDSGCSCPSPFEYQGLDDLSSGTAHEAVAAIQAALDGRGEYSKDYGDSAAVDLISRIMNPTVKDSSGA